MLSVTNMSSLAASWVPATVISDNIPVWNDGDSSFSSMTIGDDGTIHVVWHDDTDILGTDIEIFYKKYTESTGWSAFEIISDDITRWNDATSYLPKIAVGSNGQVHVVWTDYTNGLWGTDIEIIYTKYTPGVGWSIPIVISDGYGGTYWNNDTSQSPDIALDGAGNVHVVWDDFTNGWWGVDQEIMYAKYTVGSGWSNATVISNGIGGWNNGTSSKASIAIYNDIIHVVWQDNTMGICGGGGTDPEIMYACYTAGSWSNPTVISDSGVWWNDGSSFNPSSAVDKNGGVHVVWEDYTDGWWGTDTEIMYVNKLAGAGWSAAIIILDNITAWNTGNSQSPDIAVNEETITLVWFDYTDGPWGTDTEILSTIYSPTDDWSEITVVSDSLLHPWNGGTSTYPNIAMHSGKAHVVWADNTIGWWVSDVEVFYSEATIFSESPTESIPGFDLLLISVALAGIVIVFLGFLRQFKKNPFFVLNVK